MAYLIVNVGRTDGSVHLNKTWRVVRAGEKFISQDNPTSWTQGIKVIKKKDSPVKESSGKVVSSPPAPKVTVPPSDKGGDK